MSNRGKMLDSYGEVISALKILNDYYQLKSNFIICPKLRKLNIKGRELFCIGFLDTIDKRKELLRRLNKLEEREKTILLLFYTFGKAMNYIEQEICLSCRHCYRLKNKAIEKIINFDKEEKVNTS